MEDKESETLETLMCNVGENGIASCDKELIEGEVCIGKSDVNTGNNLIDPENKLFPHAPGSPTKIEVSGNDIKLSVDVFGPSDCNNETSAFDVKNGHGDEESAGKQECTLDVGDLVWIKTRTKVWWPGMISDPTGAENLLECISGQKGNFLVKHFGNGHFVWCPSSELRPFIEHFEQFSATTDSSNFNGSVEKALCEISRRVKSKMSCSCFVKGNQKHSRENKKENLMLTEKVSDFELRSLPQFDPTSFLANVKRLASTGIPPGKVDLIILKDWLSAFYHSVGRGHVPLQLLMPASSDVSDNSQDGAVTEAELKRRNHAVKTGNVNSPSIGSETRSRRKSKYLSYPYVTATKENDLNLGEDTEKTRPVAKISRIAKISRKKGARKNLMMRNTVSKEDNINASSSELLNELRASAVDYSHRISKYSDSLKRFYCSFRKFSFLDTKISSKLVGTQIESVVTMEECDQGLDFESVKQGLDISERDTAIHMEGSKREGKKKKQEAGFASKGSSLAMDSDIFPVIKPCRSDVSNHKITPSEKKKGKATGEPPQHDMITKLPDLSGEPLPENSNGSVVSQNINSGTVPSLLDVPVTFENISQLNTGVGLNCTRKIQGGDFIFEELNAGAINVGLASSHVQNTLQMGQILHPLSVKPEPEVQKTTQVASSIPDLNGYVLSEGYPVPVSAEGGPQLKGKTGEPGSSVKGKRVLNQKEDPGAGLLLKFTPDFPPPSKETLITTFSRFGLLKESEIQVLDSSTAQIMYERSSDAKFAFRSLEKSSPFGASLASFNLHGLPAVDPKATIVRKRKVVAGSQQQQPSNKKGRAMQESPSLSEIMKQKVEMMKSNLEKAGDTISPETRAELEIEIQGFLDKYVSSSSSKTQ